MRLFPKLAFMVSGLLLVAIVGVTALYYVAEERQIREDAGSQQQSVLQSLVHIAQHALVAEDDLLLAKYTHLLPQWNPEMLSASVVDMKGHIRGHSDPGLFGRTVDALSPAPSYALTVSQPVKLGGHTLGVASISFSQKLLDASLQARLGRLRHRVMSIVLVVLGAGLLASLLMALSWTRPIARLTKAFDQIGRGEWAIELGALPQRRDEIGFLSCSCLSMAAKLAELDQLKDDFVAAVSHEFRSPLSTIESYVKRMTDMRDRGDPPEMWMKHLDPIWESCERLERYVDDLLDVAYYETGKLSLDRHATDLTRLAQEVLDFYAIKFAERRIAAKVTSTPTLPKLFVDPGRIRQVFNNLVSNAIKFTPEGGQIEVHLELTDSGKNVRVTVRDNGIGIAPADQTRIFNKFEQVKTARAQIKGAKGSGLGLAISRALIELHHGTIDVKSEPGKGSAFFFKLPVVPVPLAKPVAIS